MLILHQPPRSTPLYWSAASNVYKRQLNTRVNHNDSLSTLSSSKSTHQQESEEPIESLKYVENDESNSNQSNQLGGKRGRPMTDKSLIIDEISNKIYDSDFCFLYTFDAAEE